jgi:hypothetical protein
MMEDLAIGKGVVSIIFKMVRQTQYTRNIFICPRVIIDESGYIRPDTGQQTGPGGTTYRNLAISLFEDDTILSYLVNVWRCDVPAPKTMQFRPQIVNGDEKDVRLGWFGLFATGIKKTCPYTNKGCEYNLFHWIMGMSFTYY